MRSFILTLALVLPIVGAVVVACSSDDSSGNTATACTSDSDCTGSQGCGYSPTAGCSATGTCVERSGGIPAYSACGCNGEPVPYVTDSYTNAPVTSAQPCPVPDSGSPSEDGGTDSAADAPPEGAAASEAGSDGGDDGGEGTSDGGDAGDAATD
jgi:hypothetical protein